MPTILREGPYRFFFYAGDREEPPHVHVERDSRVAKFWLEPVRLQTSGGLSRPELRRIATIVGDQRELLMESWYAYFDA